MMGNVSRDVSVGVATSCDTFASDDIVGPERVVGGSCTDSLAGIKRLATEPTIHMAHSQRVDLPRICADLSNASAARLISKLTTIE